MTEKPGAVIAMVYFAATAIAAAGSRTDARFRAPCDASGPLAWLMVSFSHGFHVHGSPEPTSAATSEWRHAATQPTRAHDRLGQGSPDMGHRKAAPASVTRSGGEAFNQSEWDLEFPNVLLPILTSACQLPGSQPTCNAMIDWVNFVEVGSTQYVAGPGSPGVLQENDLGPVYAYIKFKVSGNVCDANYRLKDGDAAFLEPGTPIYQVNGHPPSEQLAARSEPAASSSYQLLGRPRRRQRDRRLPASSRRAGVKQTRPGLEVVAGARRRA